MKTVIEKLKVRQKKVTNRAVGDYMGNCPHCGLASMEKNRVGSSHTLICPRCEKPHYVEKKQEERSEPTGSVQPREEAGGEGQQDQGSSEGVEGQVPSV